MSAREEVRLRPTRADEIDDIVAWERDPANSAFVSVWPIGRHRAALHDPDLAHLVIERDSAPAGFVLLAGLRSDPRTIELRRIVVVEKERGTGRAAVEEVIRRAFSELGASELWLDVAIHNARAAHVYMSCGFRVDPEAELWAEVDGRRTRLLKMARQADASLDARDVPAVVSIGSRSAAITDVQRHVALGRPNDHVVKLAVNEVPFDWHVHPNSDETFLVVEGALQIELEGGHRLYLRALDTCTLPAGTLHRTTPIGRCVNVVFEHEDAETQFVENTWMGRTGR